MNRLLVILFSVVFLSGCVWGGARQKSENINPTSTTNNNSSIELNDLVKIEDSFFLPILLFHHIGEPPPNVSNDNRVWYLSEEEFENVLKVINSEGFQTLFIGEALEYIKSGYLPKNSVVISFDDGTIDFYTHAWPLLQKYNMKASVNLMTGVRGENYLNKEQIIELDKTGLVEFQSHTVYHEYLTRVSDEKKREELFKSKKYIEDLLSKEVKIISYPFGLYDDSVIKIAKELGYEVGLTLRSGVWQDRNEIFRLRRNIITNRVDVEKILN